LHSECRKAENGNTGLLPSLDSATSHKVAEEFLEGYGGQKHIQVVFPILQPFCAALGSNAY